jgi:uncharacterized protein
MLMATNRNNKIDYIEFTSNDIEVSKRFYIRVFGWSFEDYGPDYTSFADGRIAGGFRKGDVQSVSGPLIVIFVDDLKSTEQRVREAGGAISKETFSFPGGSRFHFRDPSGIELAAWHED